MVILNDGGKATGIRFKKCTSVRDAQGKFAPQYDESVTETVEADTIILAIGQRIDWGTMLDQTKIQTDRGGDDLEVLHGNELMIKEIGYE